METTSDSKLSNGSWHHREMKCLVYISSTTCNKLQEQVHFRLFVISGHCYLHVEAHFFALLIPNRGGLNVSKIWIAQNYKSCKWDVKWFLQSANWRDGFSCVNNLISSGLPWELLSFSILTWWVRLWPSKNSRIIAIFHIWTVVQKFKS